jgi:hypothetical protein
LEQQWEIHGIASTFESKSNPSSHRLRKRRHMLEYQQISVLENLFMQDKFWSLKTISKNYQNLNKTTIFEIINVSIEAAASKLNLCPKKIYKWGYYRKQISRNIQTIPSSQSWSDYNSMVDDIFILKPKELSVKRRDYIKTSHNHAQNKSYFENEIFWEDERMERYKFFDDSESNINEHFSKILKQKEKSIDEFDLSSMFELTHKEVDEAASQDSPKFEFSFDVLDIDKVELENISHWTEFLLHESK